MRVPTAVLWFVCCSHWELREMPGCHHLGGLCLVGRDGLEQQAAWPVSWGLQGNCELMFHL